MTVLPSHNVGDYRSPCGLPQRGRDDFADDLAMVEEFVPQPFDPARPGLVRPVAADRRGVRGPTRAQTRTGRWRRTSRGLYVPAYVDGDMVEQRIVEVAAVLPSEGAITGWAALRWLGAEWFDRGGFGREPTDVIFVSSAEDVRAPQGSRMSQERLSQREVVERDGVRVTDPARSVAFEMRYARTFWDAVTIFDMAAYADLVDRAEIAAELAGLNGWTGIPQARRALSLVQENCWSPMESWLRLVWLLLARLPVPLCNRPVFDLSGRHLGTPDLIDPETGLIGEYDGAVHLVGRQRVVDVRREERYRDHGLEPVIALSADLRDADRLARRLNAAADRLRGERRPRDWTLEPPAWWIPTHSVGLRRALDPAVRQRLLGYRRVS